MLFVFGSIQRIHSEQGRRGMQRQMQRGIAGRATTLEETQQQPAPRRLQGQAQRRW